MNKLIDDFSVIAKEYLGKIDTRDVFPSDKAIDDLKKLNIALQDESTHPEKVLNELDEIGSPATVASTGKRYFGFVVGGSLPAALAANLLAGVWDQNAGMEAASPISSFIEEVCQKWLVDILNLPIETGVGFVTGATMANFTALAAARHALLEKMGWNVEEDGLFGAPLINVIVGEEVHVSILKALSMLGLGRNRIIRIPVDSQGRIRAELIPIMVEPTIICVQAGNVNTGAIDPIDSVCEIAQKMNAWVHVDGAFGLWANVTPNRDYLTKGIEKADSWATDAHKWLNIPHDSGLVFVRDVKHLTASMSTSAAYLVEGKKRDPFCYVPELSRRARGIEIWAALRSLGKSGLHDLIDRNCEHAKIFAEKLQRAGFKILNEIVLNQILVSFGDADYTNRVIKRIQEDGTCWCGGTVWQNQTAMRISISSWKTTEKDIVDSAEAVIRIANEEK
jgi:glutamate/tyrosine decarboxylase-like PLP-dependent enzyme